MFMTFHFLICTKKYLIMCVSPILIDNPYYNNRSPTVQKVKDTLSAKLRIPCGHCSVCLRLRQTYFVQRVQCEALTKDVWSCMLSYNNKYLPRCEINGIKHTYADIRDIQLLVKRLIKNEHFPKFTYFAISEYGGKRHRPHWHLLFFTDKIPGETIAQKLFREKQYWQIVLDNWYYNLGSKRVPIKDPMLTYKCNSQGRRNYDFRYVAKELCEDANDNSAFYASKYLLKTSQYVKKLQTALRLNLSSDDYRYYWNLMRPKSGRSIGFGDPYNPVVIKYLRDCLDFSLKHQFPFPVFINPNNGNTFPMSPYLYKKVSSPQYDIAFRSNRNHLYVDNTNVGIFNPLTEEQILSRENEFKRMCEKIDKRDIGDYISPDTTTENDMFTKVNLDDFQHVLDEWYNFEFSPNLDDF